MIWKTAFFFLLYFPLLLLAGCSTTEEEQTVDYHPKREVRAVWLATVMNKDFPSRSGLPTFIQKGELIRLLDYLKQKGINTVFFQVRSASDAFYDSKIEPWAEWITGTQNKAPSPEYDPLKMVILECHKRNIEVHAWINPYRAVLSTKYSKPSNRHVSVLYPEWMVEYDHKKYLNPGIPAVRKHVTIIVSDILKRYDVDGIHFDDYFYPFTNRAEEFEDDDAFEKYHHGFFLKSEWRRYNVNQLIRLIHYTIEEIKPHVKFGISPIAVWRNEEDDERGSKTKARTTAYDNLYADVRNWLSEGWIDYVAPQMYTDIGDEDRDYKVLLEWWQKNTFGRHLYIGMAYYKIGLTDNKEWFVSEMSRQLTLNRSQKNVQGNVFYSTKDFMSNPHSMTDTIRSKFYRYPALIPVMGWKDNIPPNAPAKLGAVLTEDKIFLQWQRPEVAEDGDIPSYFVVYRFDENETPDIGKAENILSIQRLNTYTDEIPLAERKKYTYLVTSADRLHNESKPSKVNAF